MHVAAPIIRAFILPWVFAFAAQTCAADEEINATKESGRTRYVEVIPRSHELSESARYVGMLYILSLGTYLVISPKEVFNNATLQNYARNFGNMTLFDQDLPSANWGMHIATGALAYQFYRARSYTKTDAFFLTLIQESLFQFTIETLIQPTALENVANTTIVGCIVGRGMEVASLPLLNSDFFLFRGVGYVLNLPAAFGLWESKVTVNPIIEKNKAGFALQVRF